MKVPVIFWFVLLAWSGLGASFGPVILFTLYYQKRDSRRRHGRHVDRVRHYTGLEVDGVNGVIDL